jgi:hypothetical protein
VWHGNASRIVTPLGTPARRPGPVITSREPQRAVWHRNAGPPPPVITGPPKLKPPLPRRKPQRAVVRRAAGPANAPPPPFSIGALTATDTPGATQAPADRAANALTGSTAPRSGITAGTSASGTAAYAATYGAVYGPLEATLTATDTRTGGPG